MHTAAYRLSRNVLANSRAIGTATQVALLALLGGLASGYCSALSFRGCSGLRRCSWQWCCCRCTCGGIYRSSPVENRQPKLHWKHPQIKSKYNTKHPIMHTQNHIGISKDQTYAAQQCKLPKHRSGIHKECNCSPNRQPTRPPPLLPRPSKRKKEASVLTIHVQV